MENLNVSKKRRVEDEDILIEKNVIWKNKNKKGFEVIT